MDFANFQKVLIISLFYHIFSVNAIPFTRTSSVERRDVASQSDHVISTIVNGMDSKARMFYVIVWTHESSCGGAIIDRFWVITAAQCVFGKNVSTISVEAGDFSNARSRKLFSGVNKVAIPSGYNVMSMDDDIALLKTDKSLRAFRMGLQVLPICEEARDSGTILGTCGMGSQSNDRILMYPSVLQETHYLDAYMPDCPPRQLCTESFIDKSSICVYDQGNPLYAMNCGFKKPACLYGVASHWQGSGEVLGPRCSGQNIFTRVVPLYDWISHTITTN
ncbi:azurocidin-like [Convolutriloba macropyga]|uniref:azurocidin-like n=1 Tax=Convolutriloba macropyga TaxID=536237 RepID=UPI003F51B583